jgi:hypothetical protein
VPTERTSPPGELEEALRRVAELEAALNVDDEAVVLDGEPARECARDDLEDDRSSRDRHRRA